MKYWFVDATWYHKAFYKTSNVVGHTVLGIKMVSENTNAKN